MNDVVKTYNNIICDFEDCIEEYCSKNMVNDISAPMVNLVSTYEANMNLPEWQRTTSIFPSYGEWAKSVGEGGNYQVFSNRFDSALKVLGMSKSEFLNNESFIYKSNIEDAFTKENAFHRMRLIHQLNERDINADDVLISDSLTQDLKDYCGFQSIYETKQTLIQFGNAESEQFNKLSLTMQKLVSEKAYSDHDTTQGKYIKFEYADKISGVSGRLSINDANAIANFANEYCKSRNIAAKLTYSSFEPDCTRFGCTVFLGKESDVDFNKIIDIHKGEEITSEVDSMITQKQNKIDLTISGKDDMINMR